MGDGESPAPLLSSPPTRRLAVAPSLSPIPFTKELEELISGAGMLIVPILGVHVRDSVDDSACTGQTFRSEGGALTLVSQEDMVVSVVVN
ncbi:MAG: hypothetical protein K0S99_1729 [Thermomicrobiales bacterium]|nr:hypothetical protein [Thermomicrobiales bacterium]